MAFYKDGFGMICDSDDDDEIFFSNLDNLAFYLTKDPTPKESDLDEGYLGNIFLSDNDDDDDYEDCFGTRDDEDEDDW